MIKSFKHKGLKELFETGRSKHVGSDYTKKCVKILNALAVAQNPQAMNVEGFNFHHLHFQKRYSCKVNANYRLTFAWDGEGAVEVDLEDYH